jgi:hypothetical protein
LGTFGNVGVTGITFGGVLAGRLAACLAIASAMYELVVSWLGVLVGRLYGIPRIIELQIGFS